MNKEQAKQRREHVQQLEYQRSLIKRMKAELEDKKLRAEYAKANYELMYYSLESEKIVGDYEEFVKREQAKIAEARELANKQLMEALEANKESEQKEG